MGMINWLFGVGFTLNISRIVGVAAEFTQSRSCAAALSSGSGFMRAEAGARRLMTDTGAASQPLDHGRVMISQEGKK